VRSLMRKFLDCLYDTAAMMAAVFLLLLLLTLLLIIVSRMLHLNIIGIDGYAGYFMAASGFLALAHTFQRDEHIRVTLFLNLTNGWWHRAMEIWALSASMFLSLLLAVFSVRLVLQSIEFNDISTSIDATPLWIPQMAMAAGTIILSVSILDRLWQVISTAYIQKHE
jgi:TRAP-type C4-dicarboxylate transport system permease small subunit